MIKKNDYDKIMSKHVSILSAGHSGSTLLGLVCDTIEGVSALGEIKRFPFFLHQANLEKDLPEKFWWCTCRKSLLECEHYSKVIPEISRMVGWDITTDPYKFKTTFLMNLKTIGKQSLWTRAFRLILMNAIRDNNKFVQNQYLNYFNQIINHNHILYQAVVNVRKSDFLVDASKDPLRFWLLNQNEESESKALILMRDIRAVSYSFLRKEKGNPLIRCKGWIRTYNRLLSIFEKTPNATYKLVTYEDICRDPEKVQTDIAEHLGLQNREFRKFPRETREFHIVGGNRMGRKELIDIRYDDEWETKLDEDVENEIKKLVRQNLNKKWIEINPRLEIFWA